MAGPTVSRRPTRGAVARGRLVALLLLLTGVAPRGAAFAADAPAPETVAGEEAITAATLLAHERDWPYRVALARSWAPADRAGAPLRAGLVGVLIRVGDRGLARIDFGRDGLFEIPVAYTDLVERANRVRRGELEKDVPNFVQAIGARLADPTKAPVAPVPFDQVARRRLFVCVVLEADMPEDALARLGRAVDASAQSMDDVMTIVFPIGRVPDAVMARRLEAAGWPVAFVLDHLSEPYATTLFGDQAARPSVQLTTAEGRVLFESAWTEGALPLAAAAPPPGEGRRDARR